MSTARSAAASRPVARRGAWLCRIGRGIVWYIMQAGESLCWQAACAPYSPGDDPAPACGHGPSPGHPERLVPELAMTAAERSLWAQLDPRR